MRIIGGLIIVGGLIVWTYLWLTGCEQPLCRVLGVYTYRVATLEDYREYIEGADLYKIHRASSLKFECDLLRDQFTDFMHKTMLAEAPLGSKNQVREEVERLELLGARRENKTLHMMNDVTVGKEGLDEWSEQLKSLLQEHPENEKGSWTITMLKKLFDSVVLHAGNKEMSLHIEKRFKCD